MGVVEGTCKNGMNNLLQNSLRLEVEGHLILLRRVQQLTPAVRSGSLEKRNRVFLAHLSQHLVDPVIDLEDTFVHFLQSLPHDHLLLLGSLLVLLLISHPLRSDSLDVFQGIRDDGVPGAHMPLILQIQVFHEVFDSDTASLVFMPVPQPKLDGRSLAPLDPIHQEHYRLDDLRRCDFHPNDIRYLNWHSEVGEECLAALGEFDDLLIDGFSISLDLYFYVFFYFFQKGQIYLLQRQETLLFGLRVLAFEGELAVQPASDQSIITDELNREGRYHFDLFVEMMTEHRRLDGAFSDYLGQFIPLQVKLQLEWVLQEILESDMRYAFPALAAIAPAETTGQFDYLSVGAQFERELLAGWGQLLEEHPAVLHQQESAHIIYLYRRGITFRRALNGHLQNVQGKEGELKEKRQRGLALRIGLPYRLEKSEQMEDSSISPQPALNQKKESQVLESVSPGKAFIIALKN